jgi:hypothetical protein
VATGAHGEAPTRSRLISACCPIRVCPARSILTHFSCSLRLRTIMMASAPPNHWSAARVHWSAHPGDQILLAVRLLQDPILLAARSILNHFSCSLRLRTSMMASTPPNHWSAARVHWSAYQVIEICLLALAAGSNFLLLRTHFSTICLAFQDSDVSDTGLHRWLISRPRACSGTSHPGDRIYFLACSGMRVQFWFAVRSLLTRFASYFRCAVY